MEKNKIQFKPLHEGMGFHPFSDGLPYAPESKARTSATPASRTAAGASAAGAPRMTARQLQTNHRPGAQTPRPATSVNLRSRPLIQPAASNPTAATAAASPRPARTPSNTSREVLLRTRFFAYLLDSVIHAAFWLATNLAALLLFQFQIDGELLKEHLPQFGAFYLLSQWVFIALQEVMFGNSLGKSFFELEFKRNHRSLFLRSIVFTAGLVCFGLGIRYRPQDYFGEIQFRQDCDS